MFRIWYDDARDIVCVSVKGFWTEDMVPSLAAGLHDAVAQARRISNRFGGLVESFEFPVQSSDVSMLLASVMSGIMSAVPGHAAVVVGSALNKLQAERTLVHPRLRVFSNLADAYTWLEASPLESA